MNKKCAWCGNNPCGCGVNEYVEANTERERVTIGPIFYNGVALFVDRDFVSATEHFYFYVGRELAAEIRVSEFYLQDHIPEGTDPMSFVWQLFELSQGYRDNIEYIKKNQRGRKVKFTITAEYADDPYAYTVVDERSVEWVPT